MGHTRVHPKVFGLSHNEICAYLWYYSLRSNTKGYGGKTHYTDSQNSDIITAPSGIELYHLQLSLQEASPETFRYNLVLCYIRQVLMEMVSLKVYMKQRSLSMVQ
jgi:hypothetical protein